MASMHYILTHLEKRDRIPHAVCGTMLLLMVGVVSLFGYYVWSGVQEDAADIVVIK